MLRAIIFAVLAIGTLWLGCYLITFFPVGTWQHEPLSLTTTVLMTVFAIMSVIEFFFPR